MDWKEAMEPEPKLLIMTPALQFRLHWLRLRNTGNIIFLKTSSPTQDGEKPGGILQHIVIAAAGQHQT